MEITLALWEGATDEDADHIAQLLEDAMNVATRHPQRYARIRRIMQEEANRLLAQPESIKA